MRVTCFVLSVLVGLVLATPAHAQPRRHATPPAAPASPREQAVALFAESVTAYREGRFDDAARLLDQAYALQPEPVLLYNLGRAREGAGDDDAAADAYRRYLATEGTDETDASAARARLTVLDRRIEERRALEARAAEREAEAQEATVVPTPAPAAPAREVAIAPWAIAGAGAVVLVVGGVLGALTLDRNGAVQSAPSQLAAVSAHADAESFAIGADVSFAIGAIALGIGVVWGILDLTSSPSTPSSSQARVRFGGHGLTVTF